jgi:hypothetical protein
MGLNATLKKAAQSALKATGDLANRVTYVQRTLGAYDAEADTARSRQTCSVGDQNPARPRCRR